MPLDDSSIVPEFVRNLKQALTQLGGKEEFSYDKDQYRIEVSGKYFIMYEPKPKRGWFHLSKKQVENLIEWFDSIGFKS